MQFSFSDLKNPMVVLETPLGHVDDSDGRVCGVGSSIFVPTGIKSIGDIVLLVVSVPIEVGSKVGRLVELFWRRKS